MSRSCDFMLQFKYPKRMNKQLANELVSENEAAVLSISGLKSITSEYNTHTHNVL